MIDKLEELLNMPDRGQRQEELIKYARSLRLDPELARNQRGNYIEEQLVLMIYEALTQRKKSYSQDYIFIAGGVAFLIVAFLLIRVAPALLVSMYKTNEAKEEAKHTIIQGLDKDRNPINQNNEPAIYELMDGEYSQYSKDGKLKYDFAYKNGKLIHKKEYDASGKVIFDQTFPEEGTP